MRLGRRSFMIGAATVGAGAATMAYTRRTAARPHADIQRKGDLNVLFVMSDQERAWSMYPDGFIETHCPGRAWLQENGLSFTNAYAPSQLCSIARGIVYSGRHPNRSGVWENAPIPFATPLDPSIPTMGSLFQDAGYVTGYAGKWHMSKIEEMDPGAEVTAEIRSYGFERTNVVEETDGPLIGHRHDDRTVRDALDFVEGAKDDARPWMLAVNLLNPHDVMYYTSGPEMDASRAITFPDRLARPPDTPFYNTDLGYPVQGRWGPKTREGKPPGVQEYARAMETNLGRLDFEDERIAREFQNYYWNCTRDCDQHLVRLIEGLRASGELERTVIVFVSDHGEMLGTHGMRGKGVNGYREASNVPLVIVHPDGPKGQTTDALASHVDLLPTMLSFAGVDNLHQEVEGLAGIDLAPLLEGAAGTERDRRGVLQHWTSLAFIDADNGVAFKEVFHASGPRKAWEMIKAFRKAEFGNRGHMRGAFDGTHKFARYFAPKNHQMPTTWDALTTHNDIELYDLANDPDETVNVAYEPAWRERVMAMNARTNTLIVREMGQDDGDFLPFFVNL